MRRVFFYVFQGRGDDGWIGGNGSAADVTITNGPALTIRDGKVAAKLAYVKG